jgi:hypothetical protein
MSSANQPGITMTTFRGISFTAGVPLAGCQLQQVLLG